MRKIAFFICDREVFIIEINNTDQWHCVHCEDADTSPFGVMLVIIFCKWRAKL